MGSGEWKYSGETGSPADALQVARGEAVELGDVEIHEADLGGSGEECRGWF